MIEMPAAVLNPGTNQTMRVWELVLFMAATSLGYFVVQLDVSIVNLSLPTLQSDFHVGISALQWIANAYTLSFSVALLSAGVLGDRYGNKRFLILGYAIFAIGSLACAVAPTVSTMLPARFFQGIGAAVVVPNSLALINAAFKDNKPLRVSLLSLWIAFGGAALTCGPILGGIINSVASWRYIFLINLPVCAAGILLTVKCVKAFPPRASRKQDWDGQALILSFATALLVLIINYAALSRAAIGGLAIVATVGFAWFIRVENQLPDPAISLQIFKNIDLQRALTYSVFLNFAYFGIVFFLSLYFRHALKMTVLQAGLAFIPVTLPLIVSTILSGKISRTYGPDRTIAIGFAFMIPGLLYLAIPALRGHYAWMLPAFALTTFGIGFIPSMTTAIAMLSVGPERGGMISAVLNFFRQIAGAFGVAVFGRFAISGDESASYRCFSAALIAMVCVLLAAIMVFAVLKVRLAGRMGSRAPG